MEEEMEDTSLLLKLNECKTPKLNKMNSFILTLKVAEKEA